MPAATSLLRVGAVDYVNAWPLTRPLVGAPGIALTMMRPSAVAAGLRARALDVGLVPAIELLRQPDLVAISGACIAAHGPVQSVLLLLKTAPHRVRRIALDPASRTSQVLALLVLRGVFGASATAVETDPRTAWLEAGPDCADAVLVIGDDALAAWAQAAPRIDLAAAWTAWTGLPFVFAVWAAHADARGTWEPVVELLDAAAARGAAQTGALAAEAACAPAMAHLTDEALRVYLSRRIRYVLDGAARAGLRRFLELAATDLRLNGQGTPCSI